MITKLDIEDGLAAQLDAAAKARGIPTREFICAALRQALNGPCSSERPARFVQKVHDFGTHIETPWTILVDVETDEYFLKHGRK